MGLIANNLIINNSQFTEEIQFIDSVSASHTETTSGSITQSSLIQAGDLLIVYISGNNSVGRSYSAGAAAGGTTWIEVMDASFSPSLFVAYKRAVAADSSYVQNWTWSGTQSAGINLLVYRHAQWGFFGQYNSSTGTNQITVPSVRVDKVNSRAITIFAQSQGNQATFGLPSPGVQLAALSFGSSPVAANFSAWRTIPAGTSTGVVGIGGGGAASGNSAAIQVVIKPIDNIRILSIDGGTTSGSGTPALISHDYQQAEPGDLSILIIAHTQATGNVTWTAPAGWTEVNDQGTPPGLFIMYKELASTDIGQFNYVFPTPSGSFTALARYIHLRNANWGSIGATITSTADQVTSVPSVTTTSSNSFIILIAAGTAASGPVTAGSEFNLTSNSASGVDSLRVDIRSRIQNQIGATGTATISWPAPSTGSNNLAVQIALNRKW